MMEHHALCIHVVFAGMFWLASGSTAPTADTPDGFLAFLCVGRIAESWGFVSFRGGLEVWRMRAGDVTEVDWGK